jgi:long-chain acyl-CoA synthetase
LATAIHPRGPIAENEQGRDVKQGEVGEIYLRRPLLSDFTYNNDDAKRREIALAIW